MTHRCLIFSTVPAQTPETDMTEWHTWKGGKESGEKESSNMQPAGKDWQRILLVGILIDT